MPEDLRGRSFLVTGASSGLGRASAEALAARGGRVVLAGRSEARTLQVLDRIRAAHPRANVEFLLLDVADLRSVREAAARLLAHGATLDVLMNNAGVGGTRGLSPQGLDLTYATNHVGPALLTDLLLPALRRALQGRVVNVSSIAHRQVTRIDWSVLERRTVPRRSGFADYAVTKLMNVLHAKELGRRLEGARVTTYALHPGTIATNIWRSLPAPVQWVIKRFMLSSEEGARTQVWCATAPGLANESGQYYAECRHASVNPLADDAALACELWQRTEALFATA